jgi:aquaglyceroporin related protein
MDFLLTRAQLGLLIQGVGAQVTLSQLQAGTYYSTSVVTGLAAMIGVLIAGPVSGGHINPSVTLALFVFRGFPLRKVPGYIIGQASLPPIIALYIMTMDHKTNLCR